VIKSIKIRLKPTWEQEQLFWQSCGAKRFAYNWGLARSKELYEQGVRYNKVALRKEFNEYKKQFEWIDNISAQVTANAFEDLDIAMKKFFKKESGFPKFKSRRTDRPAFMYGMMR
jgi:putative transposase